MYPRRSIKLKLTYDTHTHMIIRLLVNQMSEICTYLGGVGPHKMRQQLLKTLPVEKGFLVTPGADLFDEKDPLISSFVV